MREAIEAHGYTVDEFVDLLNENRTLTPSEAEIVQSVREYIGIPEEGSTMAKTIPQRELYRYLNAEYGKPNAAEINELNSLDNGGSYSLCLSCKCGLVDASHMKVS